ncbi:hypothetical protein [Rugosimonospora acidiphila]|uniref:hypothetical protein n=1 Tax=Rugosimonospora acidiphila TaxID=556531 RepID=UPI0031E52D7D
MGTLVTLELPDDSPVLSMPWIITFGPLSDEEEWEPVVCGPYERPHALAMAEEIVADDELMAVVEPLLPLVELDRIREEIAVARALAEEVDADEDDDMIDVRESDDEMLGELAGADDSGGVRAVPPTPDEIRAGFARIATRLTGAH